jgi:long-chain acyl-CoA synthetase
VERNVALPIPSTHATILAERDNEVALGEVGEICVRGAQVMPRCWNRPDETDRVFARDGWRRTGDMGFVGERGYLRFMDRKKDMIAVSCSEVFAEPIEDLVTPDPGDADVAGRSVRRTRSPVMRPGSSSSCMIRR